MTRDTLDFLKRLLDTPGPSGFETAPARVWREEVKTFADQVTADVHGNSLAALNPKGTPRLMLAGHIDEIGLQITRSEEHTSELQSRLHLVCRLLLEKKKNNRQQAKLRRHSHTGAHYTY